MNLAGWDPQKLGLFLLFVLPGFISLKVYDLIVPAERRDFSKALVDAVCYSTLNAAIFYLPISATSGWAHYLAWLVGFLVAPASWPFVFRQLAIWPPIAKRIVHPIQKPWDWYFEKADPSWVMIHLKNGLTIGGWFGYDSFASSYPAPEQIYLEQVWILDENLNFKERAKDTKGMLIFSGEIVSVEFLNDHEEGTQ